MYLILLTNNYFSNLFLESHDARSSCVHTPGIDSLILGRCLSDIFCSCDTIIRLSGCFRPFKSYLAIDTCSEVHTEHPFFRYRHAISRYPDRRLYENRQSSQRVSVPNQHLNILYKCPTSLNISEVRANPINFMRWALRSPEFLSCR